MKLTTVMLYILYFKDLAVFSLNTADAYKFLALFAQSVEILALYITIDTGTKLFSFQTYCN